MSKTSILYKDIAPGAAENASVTASDTIPQADLSILTTGTEPTPTATCEPNEWGLNGTFDLIDSQRLAFWSSEMSGEDCTFSSPPVITITFQRQYSSTGVTLIFDEPTGEYCPEVKIQWFQGETEKAAETYYPTSARFFCQKNVTSYDKLVITITKTNLPFRRAKLCQVMFGVYRSFDMSEIRSASVVHEMDLISSSVPESTLRWTLDSRTDVDFLFQLKQPIEVHNDDFLVGVYYIDGYNRTAENIYDIQAYDALGVLSESLFAGGVYSGYSAQQLITDIVGTDFEVDFEAEDTTLTGVIEPCTRREAIQQVLFAWGVCASTDGRASIRVFVPGDEPEEIGEDRTFIGASVQTEAIVTEVSVIAHTYTQDSNGNVEVNGKKYRDTETTYTVKNPDVTATDKQNTVEVRNATLVSPTIGQAVAQRVYDFYSRRNTHKAKVAWKGEVLGDCVTLPNAWGSTNTGNISRMEITLSNTIVASCETIGV